MARPGEGGYRPGVAASSGLSVPAGPPLVRTTVSRDSAAASASAGQVGIAMDVEAGLGLPAVLEGAAAPME
eukprot:6736361-Prorocentrum_lima.AAC.1